MLPSNDRSINAAPPQINLKMLIDGQWVEAASGRRIESYNPANGELIGSVPEGDVEDVDRAVVAARRAFEGPWRNTRPAERQRILLRLADLVEARFDELALTATMDMGAPITRQRGFKPRAVGMLRYYAGLATAIHGETIENSLAAEVLSYTLREPIGVVGAIIPWNGPIPATIWKLGPVLATGCTCILKPAEDASLVPLRIGELLMEAGVPPGVVNIVTGYGRTAGARLAAHPDVDKIAFTGSHLTGQQIVAASASNMKRLSLELGGKSPNIVFADANLDAAAVGAANAAFANTGQVCSAGTRLFVEKSIYEAFVEKVSAHGASMRVGDGMKPDTQLGPLVSKRQHERVTNYLAVGKSEGARVVSGGEALTSGEYAKGHFVSPTVFADVRDDMRVATEEIFGPVLSALPFTDLEDVAKRANASIYGLGSGIWTRDVSKVHKLARRIQSGVVWVNSYQLADPAVPFGGYKMSGYGRESGIHHVLEYTNTKSVWVNLD